VRPVAGLLLGLVVLSVVAACAVATRELLQTTCPITACDVRCNADSTETLWTCPKCKPGYILTADLQTCGKLVSDRVHRTIHSYPAGGVAMRCMHDEPLHSDKPIRSACLQACRPTGLFGSERRWNAVDTACLYT
jgi:hypothetical protein